MNQSLAKYTLILMLLGQILAFCIAVSDILIADNSTLIELICNDFGESEEEKSEMDDECVQKSLKINKFLVDSIIDFEHSFYHYSEAHPQINTPPPEA